LKTNAKKLKLFIYLAFEYSYWASAGLPWISPSKLQQQGSRCVTLEGQSSAQHAQRARYLHTRLAQACVNFVYLGLFIHIETHMESSRVPQKLACRKRTQGKRKVVFIQQHDQSIITSKNTPKSKVCFEKIATDSCVGYRQIKVIEVHSSLRGIGLREV
jgi:hypothetical protein